MFRPCHPHHTSLGVKVETSNNTFPPSTLSVGSSVFLKILPRDDGETPGRAHTLWKESTWLPMLALPLTDTRIYPACASVYSSMRSVTGCHGDGTSYCGVTTVTVPGANTLHVCHKRLKTATHTGSPALCPPRSSCPTPAARHSLTQLPGVQPASLASATLL